MGHYYYGNDLVCFRCSISLLINKEIYIGYLIMCHNPDTEKYTQRLIELTNLDKNWYSKEHTSSIPNHVAANNCQKWIDENYYTTKHYDIIITPMIDHAGIELEYTKFRNDDNGDIIYFHNDGRIEYLSELE